ncbi:MAG: hypothetical protein Q9209_007783 [Squamulea sp. 1 TL-2023]
MGMETDLSLSYNDEIAQQFEREGVEVHSPHRHHIHSHPFLPEKASGDEDPLDLTLAPKAPVLTSIERESVNTLNRTCFPPQRLQEIKRKGSEVTEHAAKEPAKKSRIASANSGVAIDAFKESSQIYDGKLSRPHPELIGGKVGIPVNPKDPFEMLPDHQEKPNLGTNDDQGGNHTSHGNAAEDQEYENYGQESREYESKEQESNSEESDDEEIGSEVSEQQDAHDPQTATNNSKPELLGTDDIWKRITDARRAIGLSNIWGHNVKKVPSLKTEHGKVVVERIEAAAQIFEFTNGNQSDVSPRRIIKNLTRCIDRLSKTSCQGEESKVIQEIYVHALPKMVTLLDKAFKARRIQLSDPNNISCIGEIIQLQDAFATLCKKARGWRPRPESDRPIAKHTITIHCDSERMRTAFSKELKDRKRRLKMQAAKANNPPEIDEVIRQRELDEARRRNGRRRQVIIDACLRGCETEWRQRPISQPQIQKPDPIPATARLSTIQHVKEGWSREQDEAFLTEFQRNKLRDLSGMMARFVDVSMADLFIAEEVCLEVLNAPLLQNMLPEHIKERARYFKAAIEANLSPQMVPKWISSL